MAFPLSLIVKSDSESDNESDVDRHDDKMMIIRVIIRVRTNDDETHGEIDAERICEKV